MVNSEQKATLSTNDIVINKLTQILSYLRAGNRTKRKKKDKMEDLLGGAEEVVIKRDVAKTKEADIPIYDDVGDYKPSKKDDRRDDRKRDKYRDDYRDDKRRDRDRRDDRRDRDRHRDRSRERDRDERERNRDDRGRNRDRDRDRERDDRRSDKKHSYFDKPSSDHQEKQQKGFSNEDKVCNVYPGKMSSQLCPFRK